MRILMLLPALVVLVACFPGTDGAAQIPTQTLPQPTASPPTTNIAQVPPSATQPATESPIALTAALSATLAAQLQLPPQDRVDEISSSTYGVLPLPPQAGQLFWAVSLPGWRAHSETLPQHFVAIYTHTTAGWQELSRVVLPDPDGIIVTLAPYQLSPDRTWIAVQGWSGPIGPCCYTLLSFDGHTVRSELSFAERYFTTNYEDLDRDGRMEVVLTINEQSCGNCNAAPADIKIFRWEGTYMAEKQLSLLPESIAVELRQANDRAVRLARHDLWKQARQAISQTMLLTTTNPIAFWNTVLIRRTFEERMPSAQPLGSDSPASQLVGALEVGDFVVIRQLLQQINPAEIFVPEPPLIAGRYGSSDLEVRLAEVTAGLMDGETDLPPVDLATEYFLRAWKYYLFDTFDPAQQETAAVSSRRRAAIEDLQQAVRLAPQEALFANSLRYLEHRR